MLQRAQIEDPIPIITRPLWPLYSSVLQVDTVTVVRRCCRAAACNCAAVRLCGCVANAVLRLALRVLR